MDSMDEKYIVGKILKKKKLPHHHKTCPHTYTTQYYKQAVFDWSVISIFSGGNAKI